MQILGAASLVFGITILIMSFPGAAKPMLPSWTASIGGGLVVFSYFLSWRD